ncbi:MAG: type II toxin-antitoxin system HigA family antitoxin [Cytophagaceae bacterium]
MEIRPIRNINNYNEALERLELIFDAKQGTPEGDELEILTILIDKYEKENFLIDLPDPIEAVKFRMEQLNMKQKDLAATIGFKSRVSEVLNRKRKLTLDMIRKLHEQLNIPTNILIKEYNIAE